MNFTVAVLWQKHLKIASMRVHPDPRLNVLQTGNAMLPLDVLMGQIHRPHDLLVTIRP